VLASTMNENRKDPESYQCTEEQMNQIHFLMQCQNFKNISLFIDQLIRYEYFRMQKFIKIKDSPIDAWDIELFEDTT